jgi:hypothetical protein
MAIGPVFTEMRDTDIGRVMERQSELEIDAIGDFD